jgi:GH35 family endo-1,4-beta-xylanase
MQRIFVVLLSALFSLTAAAQGFPLVTRTAGATPIYVDPKDHWLVKKAAQLLQEDIARVTGIKPPILDSLPTSPQSRVIIIGSMDSSQTIRVLMRQHKLTAKLAGKWEAYILTTLPNTLVIAGSDRRGTTYGALELSRRIGVSPWYYWADVPVPHQDELYFDQPEIVSDGPAVKYRGFFINDEAPALSGWVHEKFGNFNHHFYEHVFELLLRLKANYLWPAMWGNAFNDDDTLNPILADKYGIVMGTSHHEPMLRAQQEWKRYGSGPWDYTANAPILDSFWRTGIQHMDHHESIVTVGMRGDGDKPMQEESNIALLEKIVKDQRNIIAEVTKKPAAETPQSWALYKEVQDYYDKGMRVPDDITLLLCDDNWGNVRKLPSPGAKPRPGGYGLYYHFDYVGGPRNYKWINTNQLPRIWEELNLTRSYGANRIWIVNVGDIKPLEFPTQFFLDYAWDPTALPASQLPAYTYSWAAQQFGTAHAAAIADILNRYTQYNARRKPELLSPDTYSLPHYREWETVAGTYRLLAATAQDLSQRLPADYQDAYYELVLYPVEASANLYELYYTVAKNHLYAAQGRAATNDLAAKADTLFANDSLLARHYNRDIAAGKWSHMMDQTHIGYTGWQEPRHNIPPHTDTIELANGPVWGVAVEGSAHWWPAETSEASLPAFNPYDHIEHYIDIFNRRNTPFNFTIHSDAPWITLSSFGGQIDKEQRIRIGIRWDKLPVGAQTASLTITGPEPQPITITVNLDRPSPHPATTFKGFVETNGCIALEAEHFSKAVNTAGIQWQVIPGLGKTLSGVEAQPVTALKQTPAANSPRLEYSVWLTDTGTIKVQAWCSPILEFNCTPIHYAIAFDDEKPQLIDLTTGNEARGTWDRMVADNSRIAVSTHTIQKPGAHLLKFYLVDPGVVLQRLVIDAGGLKPSYLGPPESPRQPEGLAAAYKAYFPIGVAVSNRSITSADSTLIIQQFNSLTPENAMKMGPIHPREDFYNWAAADAIVDFAGRHGMRVRGHNLCWHEQTPDWLFKDAQGKEVTKEVLLQRLEDHITTVVNRYKGKVYAWDVVNEAVADDMDSSQFLRNSAWYRICGPEFIAKAFEYAHAADPDAQLFYNDYNTERPGKRERVYRLLKQLVDAGVPITGVGLQGHWSIYEPSGEELQTAIDRFASLGLKVQITELDVSIYPWEKNRRARRPDENDQLTPELEQRQAEQYSRVFSLFRANAAHTPADTTVIHPVINGVTFWNVSDKHTWLDEYPVPGRKNYPLLFDINNQPKKAFYGAIDF